MDKQHFYLDKQLLPNNICKKGRSKLWNKNIDLMSKKLLKRIIIATGRVRNVGQRGQN